jgi:hypothetical protein
VIITVGSYSDFKAAIKDQDDDDVFYYSNSNPQYQMLGLSRRVNVAVLLPTQTGSLPGTFSTDFPNAIALTASISVS